MKRRLSAILLSLAMCLAMIPGMAFATDSKIPFSDVEDTAWYYTAVEYNYENELMYGTSDTIFEPNTTLDRAMLVTILHRLDGSPAPKDEASFSDVNSGSWYTEAIAWAAENNIVAGYGDGTFGPHDAVTRQQTAAIFYRYADYKEYDISATNDLSSFSDAGDVSDWATASVQWTVAVGLISGMDDGTLQPAGTTTRAQLASIMMRFCENIVPNENPDPDPEPSPEPDPTPAPEPDPEPSESSEVTVPSVLQLGNQGYIMGYKEGDVHAFKGIRYGTADRFKRANMVTQYGTAESPTNVLTNGAVSPQGGTNSESSKAFAAAAFMTPSDSDMFSIEANCLNLNVWTNNLDQNANKPVLVFFHGGGTTEGSAIELKMYDGKYFADYTDVIFVSVNARLNYLGYADLTAIGGDSNLGLSDMVLSLEWVKNNIKYFGGNPDNVTIMGQSGGGTKVSALASSPKALNENLFQRVVISSGFGATARTPEYTANQAQQVASRVRSSELFVNWYRNEKALGDDMSWADIKAAAAQAEDADVFAFLQQVRYDDLSSFGLSTGTFTADGEYFDEAGSLTANGLNETARHYTYLIGSAWAEMGGNNSADAVLGNWSTTGRPGEAVSSLTEEQKKERMEAYLANRVGDYDETKAAFETAYPNHDFYDLRSLQTTNFDNSTYKNMAGLVNEGNQVFNYFSAYTMPYFGGMTMIHTGDLAFFFHSIDTAPYQIAGDEENAHKVADTMASALAAFCTNGNPSIEGLDWEPMSTDTAHTTILDVQSRCVTPDFNATLRGLIARN
ncbi:MAG: carboxylesterase family protein [Eubacteriales bacterium]|nr:carboxylesterase family protein [Eubacteriales bacterium]